MRKSIFVFLAGLALVTFDARAGDVWTENATPLVISGIVDATMVMSKNRFVSTVGIFSALDDIGTMNDRPFLLSFMNRKVASTSCKFGEPLTIYFEGGDGSDYVTVDSSKSKVEAVYRNRRGRMDSVSNGFIRNATPQIWKALQRVASKCSEVKGPQLAKVLNEALEDPGKDKLEYARSILYGDGQIPFPDKQSTPSAPMVATDRSEKGRNILITDDEAALPDAGGSHSAGGPH